MSYIKEKTQFVKRRHPTRRVTSEELLADYNRHVDRCNEQIAKAQGTAQHWFEVSQELGEINLELRRALVDIRRAKTLGEVRGIVNRVLGEG